MLLWGADKLSDPFKYWTSTYTGTTTLRHTRASSPVRETLIKHLIQSFFSPSIATLHQHIHNRMGYSRAIGDSNGTMVICGISEISHQLPGTESSHQSHWTLGTTTWRRVFDGSQGQLHSGSPHLEGMCSFDIVNLYLVYCISFGVLYQSMHLLESVV